MKQKVYDELSETLTEYGRFRLYMFIARKLRVHSGYKFIGYGETARALGLSPREDTRHVIEMGVWSLHGDRHGEFRLIKVKTNNDGRRSLDSGYTALLRVKPSRLRERGFTKFADMYDACEW